jgi:hypothetical protein
MQLHEWVFLLGSGARLLDNVGGADVALDCTRVIKAPDVTHLTYGVIKNGANL